MCRSDNYTFVEKFFSRFKSHLQIKKTYLQKDGIKKVNKHNNKYFVYEIFCQNMFCE
jgi:hypothetical protein